MAKILDIGYQTVLLVTNTPEKYKGASLVFQELVVYCIRRGVSMDEIAQAFYNRNNADFGSSKHLMQVSDFYMHCPLLEEYEQAFMLEEAESSLMKAYLFMYPIRMIYCKGCMHFWRETEPMECLIHQTMEIVVKRLR